ncbi:DUF1476 domain-containing protein [Fulvimarina sp. 2208YS6-2-32]|uniref:DUF1476 domain-containing protein n=1 Tax=Fulvimarina uroteuthidis TaxID=3098149 RepID=A0ABU5I3U5_9HYPH|nr:DUF1476 domain-containing protein [Fulvimarina sp. 2208YS6-2-32]MDY8110056.1 DUF1476 domain-containing protein [Fulvimarina sp. 2208YS6-2-32]
MTMADRERDFENRFIHDQELKFRIRARRNKLAGLWAAGIIGKTGADANAYAQEIVRVDFEKPGDDDVFEHLRDDLAKAGSDLSDADIRAKLVELLQQAEREVMAE